MTYYSALKFFSDYGGVDDIPYLARETPSERQLDACVEWAVNVCGRDRKLAEECKRMVWYWQRKKSSRVDLL